MRNIYQEKRIDRLKTQGIKLEARSNHMHNMPINNPNPIASYIGVMTLPGPVAGCHDENMMDDPI
ncbi:hypothetical protein ACW5XE_18750 [Aeromonas caviae]|jgi:hypothetical protein|uniref:hypothetical protein n=1 Tax=Aeromonas caviae TaxID=648 RepID=UPI0029D6DB6A|nr:hypothetical protein [Aeromonas caviae]MDX7806856.1 hypothetical protein [Aeromonas caviae]